MPILSLQILLLVDLYFIILFILYYIKLHYTILLYILFLAQNKKIMPRSQNAHALVNAGFLFKLDNNGNVLKRPNIIFGGIRPDFVSNY